MAQCGGNFLFLTNSLYYARKNSKHLWQNTKEILYLFKRLPANHLNITNSSHNWKEKIYNFHHSLALDTYIFCPSLFNILICAPMKCTYNTKINKLLLLNKNEVYNFWKPITKSMNFRNSEFNIMTETFYCKFVSSIYSSTHLWHALIYFYWFKFISSPIKSAPNMLC